MHQYIVFPSALKGATAVPPSKSHTMRALLFGALAQGTSIIHHYLSAPDTNHMIEACGLLGAKIVVNGDRLEIKGVDGVIPSVENVLYAGNSGLILRFAAAVASLCPTYTIITGDHSIRHNRPMQPLLDALNQLGAFAMSARGDGFAPILIRGPLKGGQAVISGEDSQPVSSLLIACSLAEGASEIIVKNPGEIPWVKLTLSWLDFLGVHYKNDNFERFTLPGRERFKAFEYTVPGDWSSAAFPIAAALITQSSITIENVDMADPQGDKELVGILQVMGASIEVDEKGKRLHVHTGGILKGIEVDVNPFIDAVPILAVLACFAEGETHLVNAAVAREKECDRLHVICAELKKMGADITEKGDSLVVRGAPLQGAHLASHGDHRIAMALVVAAFGAKGNSQIEDIDCVSKTFPQFSQAFQSLGARIEVKAV